MALQHHTQEQGGRCVTHAVPCRTWRKTARRTTRQPASYLTPWPCRCLLRRTLWMSLPALLTRCAWLVVPISEYDPVCAPYLSRLAADRACCASCITERRCISSTQAAQLLCRGSGLGADSIQSKRDCTARATSCGAAEFLARPHHHTSQAQQPALGNVQVGLAEMKNVVELSGGLVIQTDSFGNSVFKDSFRNLLSGPEESRSVSLASNAIFEVQRVAPAHAMKCSTGVVFVAPALLNHS